MIYDDDGGGLSPLARKLLLLGAVVVGVPLLALGIGAFLSRQGEVKKRKSEEEEQPQSPAEPEPKPPGSPEPVSEPASEPPGSNTEPSACAPSAAPEPAAAPAPPAEVREPAAAPAPPAEAPEPAAAPAPPAEVPEPAAAPAPPAEVREPAAAPAPPAEVRELHPEPAVAPALRPTGTAPEEASGEAVSRESVLQTLTLLLSEHTEVKPEGESPSLEDRRQAVRLKVDFPVQVRAGTVSQGSVIDLSLTGARVKCDSPLMIGESCHLSLPGQPDQEVGCVVMWCISGDVGASRAGLRFTDSAEKLTHSWVVDRLLQAGLNEGHLSQKRRWIRVHTQTAVKVRDERETEFEATMLDLGVGGARIRTEAALKIREGVRLVIPTGKKQRTAIALSALVVANRGQEFHLQFLPPGKGLQKRLEAYILELLSAK